MAGMTMKQMADYFKVPYGYMVEMVSQMRGGWNQVGHNVEYDPEAVKEHLLANINARIEKQEKALLVLLTRKHSIEFAGLEEAYGELQTTKISD